MDVVSGQNQVGAAGAELAEPLVVKVVNGSGQAVGNQIVNFRVIDGGGSAYGETAVTNSAGLAQERWTLGSTAGEPQKVEARAVDGANGQKLLFATFTATAVSPAQLIATVTVTPATPSRVVGATVQLTAIARNASGTTLSGKVFTWSSSNSAVATVSASGLVTASSAGTATITASCEGKNGTATITVSAAPPPPSQTDTIFYEGFEAGNLFAWTDGLQSQFTVVNNATLAYAGSHLLRMNVPANGAGGHLAHFFMPGYDSVFVRLHVRYAANWTSNTYVALLRGSRTDDEYSSFGVAGFCPNGTDWFATNVTTTGAGNPGASQFYSYWVGMPREANGVTCSGRFGNGNETYFAQASMARDVWHRVEFWVKLNTPGQSNSVQKMWIDGQLRGEWNGLNFRTTTDVRLNSLSILAYPETSSSTARTIYYDEILLTNAPVPGSFEIPPPPPPPAPVATVTVSPASVALNAGATQQLSATLRDASGTLLTGRTVTWSSNNTSVATVSAAGLASAVAAGGATITATSEGMSGASSVTVTAAPPPAPVATVTVSPASVALNIGATQQLTATLRDANGNTLTGRTVTWSSSNTNVATAIAGLAMGVAAGTATVTATSEGRSGTSSVTVNPSGSFAPPDIISHNFDNGTLGGFSDPFQDGTTTVMNDPTGRLSGQVVRINYDINPGGVEHQDKNRYFETDISAQNHAHIFVRCDFVLGTPTGNDPQLNRKMLYIKSASYPAGNGWAMVVGLDDLGPNDRNRLSTSYGETNFFPTSANYNVQFNRRYTLELEVKRNSSTGASDGLIRVWLTDDQGVTTLAQQRLNLRIATQTTQPVDLVEIGRQVDRFYTSDDVSEFRYWDRCALSTKRIGP